MLYHCTYRARSGAIEIARVGADSRAGAKRTVAWRYGIPVSAVTSAVAIRGTARGGIGPGRRPR